MLYTSNVAVCLQLSLRSNITSNQRRTILFSIVLANAETNGLEGGESISLLADESINEFPAVCFQLNLRSNITSNQRRTILFSIVLANAETNVLEAPANKG